MSAALRVLWLLLLGVAASAGAESVTVLYPAGDCATGRIDVQVFDRQSRVWGPHPEHPQLATGRCVSEESGVLLNELRIRCIDPSAQRAPSAWVVGAEVFRALDASECEPGSN